MSHFGDQIGIPLVDAVSRPLLIQLIRSDALWRPVKRERERKGEYHVSAREEDQAACRRFVSVQYGPSRR